MFTFGAAVYKEKPWDFTGGLHRVLDCLPTITAIEITGRAFAITQQKNFQDNPVTLIALTKK